MKKTPNMVIKETDESRELALCLANDGRLWSWIMHIKDTLAKHIKKGVYDHERAIEAYYPVATKEAKLYIAEFGSDDGFAQCFDVTARWTAAEDLLCYIEAEYLFKEVEQ